jgi:hypothetical protein
MQQREQKRARPPAAAFSGSNPRPQEAAVVGQ